MRIIDIIEKKRDKQELSKEEIEYFVTEYSNGNIKDYQADNGMEIGGMGLLNAYARLILFLGDDVKLTLYGSEWGTRVVISAPVDL